MQSATFILLVIVGVYAETPDYRAAPYLESGWKPSGPIFRLPIEQKPFPKEHLQPPNEYGPPPFQTYGPPKQQATTEIDDVTTTELPETTTDISNESEKLKEEISEKSAKLVEDAEDLTEKGVYYVYHPTGLLQRVAYLTKNDQKNMAFTAQLKYMDVEPIRDPIYTYDPKTLRFERLRA